MAEAIASRFCSIQFHLLPSLSPPPPSLHILILFFSSLLLLHLMCCRTHEILAANALDVESSQKEGISLQLLQRLQLTEAKV
jgi:hypothetical protein